MAKKSKAEKAGVVPLINPLDNLLGYQLRRASQVILEDLVRTLEDLDLRPTTTSIVLLVAANPGVTQSRIGQFLAIERANMVPMTAKLVKQGLLTRAPADGRSHGLHLTEEGRKVAATLRKRIAAHEAPFWKGLGSPERAALLKFLKSLWTESN
jgi:DNA-binding MarR family transcriptional regulator